MRKLGKKKGEKKVKNLLIKAPIELYSDLALKHLNAKLSDPRLSKNDFLIYVLKKGIERIEEEEEKKNE